jgi:hypothetical protein
VLTEKTLKLINPKLLFYLFAVSMILLRPFLTYEMTMQGKINSTEAVNNLFQRLIKKKDSHSGDFIESTDLFQSSEVEVILPLLFVIFLRRKASWLVSFMSGNNLKLQIATVFQVMPCNDYYQRISRLQI